MSKANTQIEWVQAELAAGRTVTSWRAIQEIGATRLSAIIYTLKEEGMDITKEMVEVENRFGSKTHIAEYSLVK
jgi:hypothetical protein